MLLAVVLGMENHSVENRERERVIGMRRRERKAREQWKEERWLQVKESRVFEV